MTVALALVPETAAAAPPPAARGLLLGGTGTAIGLLLVAFLLHLGALSGVAEHRDQVVLRAAFRDQLRHGTAPVTLPLPAGRPMAVLQVPRLGLDLTVLQGSDAGTLRHGPGHRASTSLPGQAGTSVILGRRSAYGGPFAQLDRLRVGDLLTATTGLGRATFRVDDVHRGDAARQLPPGDARLQLVTSDPAWTPTRALVVSAVLVDAQPLPAPAGLPAPDPHELALHGDPRAAGACAAWAGALLALSGLLTWGWQRLARPVLWVGGVPLALAVLWELADSLTRLLPGTL